MARIDFEKEEVAAQLKGSFLEFTKTFFKLATSRDFIVSQPIGRESHHIVVARALTSLFNLNVPNHRQIITLPPGHGKSVFMSMWVAWAMAQYPDSNFLYISYSKTVAAKHTEFIKRIMSMPMYEYLFGVSLMKDSRAKDLFKTTSGGTVAAFGAAGSIVGTDAGLPGLDRFSGAVIIDDAHKIDEAHSDTIREGVIENYRETIQQRGRGINVPIVFVGQRVHEADLAAYMMDGKDGYEWDLITLKSLDHAGNALYPEAFPKEMLEIKREHDPYVFASQYQQDPIPAGGALYKPDWFAILDEDPEPLVTFITADTAETDKAYNDATAFSFFSLYEITFEGKKTGELGIHWIDTIELRLEPKDLEAAFLDFYAECMRYKMPPSLAAIEKKSTGVTLLSTLKELRGLRVIGLDLTRQHGSKSQRFIDMQSFIAKRLVSLPNNAKHTKLVLEHMSKITANNTHRFDDIADTLSHAIRVAFIDKSLHYKQVENTINEEMSSRLGSRLAMRKHLGAIRNAGSSY